MAKKRPFENLHSAFPDKDIEKANSNVVNDVPADVRINRDMSPVSIDDIPADMIRPAKYGIPETMARGVGQGFLGLGDEIEAAYEAAHSYLPKNESIQWILENVLNLPKPEDTGVDYSGMKWEDRYRIEQLEASMQNRDAKKEHPLAYYGSEIPAAIATYLGASTGGVLGLTAAGAVHGAGSSESNTWSGLGLDIAVGAGLGAISGGVGKGVTKLVEFAGNKVIPAAAGLAVKGISPGASMVTANILKPVASKASTWTLRYITPMLAPVLQETLMKIYTTFRPDEGILGDLAERQNWVAQISNNPNLDTEQKAKRMEMTMRTGRIRYDDVEDAWYKMRGVPIDSIPTIERSEY